jgi:predicted anti-sigma-YlaC factor YlaD
MDCNELDELLPDYLDREARDEICREIEKHLKSCKDCIVKVNTITKTIVLVSRHSQQERIVIPILAQEQLHAALTLEYSRGSAVPTSD